MLRRRGRRDTSLVPPSPENRSSKRHDTFSAGRLPMFAIARKKSPSSKTTSRMTSGPSEPSSGGSPDFVLNPFVRELERLDGDPALSGPKVGSLPPTGPSVTEIPSGERLARVVEENDRAVAAGIPAGNDLLAPLPEGCCRR